MPSTSPGISSNAPTTATPFAQILPGRPTAGYQSQATLSYRFKRYVAYISGAQLNVLSSPTTLVQAITFPEPLVSIVAEARTGQLAVAGRSAENNHVWVLEAATEGWSRVWWEKSLLLRTEDAKEEARWLSWGDDGELLVGGDKHLNLFSTVPRSRTSSPQVSPVNGKEHVEERKTLWSKAVSSSVRWAAFSPGSNLIATCGDRDRLVKIWRRLSFEEALFDHTYLPHPGAVTHLQWREMEEGTEDRRGSGKSGRHDEDPEILHTIASDGILRVWRTGGIHDLDILGLHTTVDLVSAIPQSPSLTVKASAPVPVAKSARYAFTIPSFHFAKAVKAAIGLQPTGQKLSYSLEHLKEVASKEPDIVIALDGHGRMSAWGLQSIGHKRRPETPSGISKQAFHIAHCEDLPLTLRKGEPATFEVWLDDAQLNILSHGFNGEVRWWRGDAETFFSPSASGNERLRELSCWSGHQNDIAGLRSLPDRNVSATLLSWTRSRNLVCWRSDATGHLRLDSTKDTSNHIFDAIPLVSSDGSANIEGEDQEMIIRYSGGAKLDVPHTTFEGAANRRLWSAACSTSKSTSRQRLVMLCKTGSGLGCNTFTLSAKRDGCDDCLSFHLPLASENDKVQSCAAVLGADQSDRFGIVVLMSSGKLLLYHVDVPRNPLHVEPVLMATFETGIAKPSKLVASNEFAAVVSEDKLELFIFDLRDGYMEHAEQYKNRIEHVCPGNGANVLAVGFKTHVDVLVQGRIDHCDYLSTWTSVKVVSIIGLGLSVNGMAWLGTGTLALAAGNGIFVASDDLPVGRLPRHIQEVLGLGAENAQSPTLSTLTQGLKSAVPVWHPSYIIHLVQCGRWSLGSSLIARLLEKLKFWSEGDHLDVHLNVPAEQLYGQQELTEHKRVDDATIAELQQQLEEKDLPHISRSEQEHLSSVLSAMLFCDEHVRGLDICALRFLFVWKLQQLELDTKDPKPNGTATDGIAHTDTSTPQMHWREIAFAHQSTTQQPLLDILTAAHDNKITWSIARRLGLFAWISDREALAPIFEALAQSTYRASSPPDPINASLYFLALHKKSTLLGLWRIATWHREQRATTSFLKRDFGEEANRTAARKNAYALMGKRRFDYAAAFFLLAEDAASATSVLAGQCGDVMLAIAVSRLYAGDGSPVLRKLLEDRLLPEARKAGDRWQMSWCHAVLAENVQAAEVLIQPLDGVSKWQQDDPLTLSLYGQLRKQESEWEWEAVLRGARILRRMDLSIAAVKLVRDWKFLDLKDVKPSTAREANGTTEQSEVPSMLDDFTSPPSQPKNTARAPSMLDDFSEPKKLPPSSMLDGFGEVKPQQDEATARAAKAAELMEKLKAKKAAAAGAGANVTEKKAPTQFKEPDSNSLLDSFGF